MFDENQAVDHCDDKLCSHRVNSTQVVTYFWTL